MLPSLNSIRAFEAAARHLSLTKAAEELCVTSTALSHQISGLEKRLGRKLFHRTARGITLTELGKQLYPPLFTAFQTIGSAFDQLEKADDILVINSPPAFVSKWLIPRVHKFIAMFPQFELRISASRELTTFGDGTDLAVRYLTKDVSRSLFHTTFLVKDVLIPVCSPSLLNSMSALPKPGDLAGQTLIHFDPPSDFTAPGGWNEWLDHVGLSGIDVTKGPRFYQPEHVTDAAAEGLGVALCYRVLALSDLHAGRLIIPFGPELEMGGLGYYLVCPRQKKESAKVKAFSEWISAEMTASLADVSAKDRA